MLTVPIAASASGTNEILPATAGYKYRVIGFKLSFGGTVSAKFQSASTDLTGEIYGVAGTQSDSTSLNSPQPSTPPSQFTTTAGEALNLSLSGAVAVGGFVIYERVPASM